MRRADAMQRLYAELQETLPGITNSASCGVLLNTMFEMPIFSKPTISARITGVNTATVQRMINSLVDAGVLHVRSHGAGRRATIYHLGTPKNSKLINKLEFVGLKARGILSPRSG